MLSLYKDQTMLYHILTVQIEVSVDHSRPIILENDGSGPLALLDVPCHEMIPSKII